MMTNRDWVGIIYIPDSTETVTSTWSKLKVGGLSPLDFFISSFFNAVRVAKINILFSSNACKDIISKSSYYIQNGLVNVIDESKSLEEDSHPPFRDQKETTSNKFTICFSLRYYPMWKNNSFSLSNLLYWIEINHLHQEHVLITASPTQQAYPSNTMAIVFDNSSSNRLPSISTVQEYFSYNNSVHIRTTEITAPLEFTFHDLLSSSAEDIALVDDVHRSSFSKIVESLPLFVREKCPARVGLMGNPSDGFRGKTLSFLIENYSATVEVEANPSGSSSVRILDPLEVEGFIELDKHSRNIGYEGARRLLQAACKVFSDRCLKAGIVSHLLRGFQMSYHTDIPRMVGLSGSSAIVVAAFRALMKYYGLTIADLRITQSEFPQVILDVERVELGIAAGLQDRVIQVYGGLVHMDFSTAHHAPVYTPLSTALLPKMYLIYDTITGGDSGKVHSTVKQRWLDNDPALLSGMAAIAGYADRAVESLRAGDYQALALLATKNFAMRRQLYGDAVVGPRNISMVELAGSFGLSAKFTGSGGAILCLRSDGTNEWLLNEEECRIREAFQVFGFHFERISIPAVAT